LACAKTELDLFFAGRQINFRIKSAQLLKNIKKTNKIMSKQTLTKAVLMGSIKLDLPSMDLPISIFNAF